MTDCCQPEVQSRCSPTPALPKNDTELVGVVKEAYSARAREGVDASCEKIF